MEGLILLLAVVPGCLAFAMSRRLLPYPVFRAGAVVSYMLASAVSIFRTSLSVLENATGSVVTSPSSAWPGAGGALFSCDPLALGVPGLLFILAALATHAILRHLPEERSGSGIGLFALLVLSLYFLGVSGDIVQTLMAFVLSGVAFIALMEHWHGEPVCRAMGVLSSLLFVAAALVTVDIARTTAFSGLEADVVSVWGKGFRFAGQLVPHAFPAAVLVVLALLARMLSWLDVSAHGQETRESLLARGIAAGALLFEVVPVMWQFHPLFRISQAGMAFWMGGLLCVFVVGALFLFYPNRLFSYMNSFCEKPFPRYLRRQGTEMAGRMAQLDDMLSSNLLSRMEKGAGGFSFGMNAPRDIGHFVQGILAGLLFLMILLFLGWGGV